MFRERIVAVAASLGLTMALGLAASHVGEKEGLSLKPYKDLGGVTTWCYGQTQGPRKASYTQAECDQNLVLMTKEYYDAVRPWIPANAPASVVAGFTSTAVNIGKAGWKGSQFASGFVPAPYMEDLKAGRWKAACDKIAAPWPGKYGTAPGYKATIGGYPSKGLGSRRASDAALCRSGL